MNWQIFIGVCIGLLSCGAFYFTFKLYKTYRLIKDMPTVPIGNVVRQLAEVKGRAVEGDRPMTSPAARQPCVYYKIEVEKYRQRHSSSSSSSSSGTWDTIHKKESSDPIYIEDGSGQARVALKGASLLFAQDSSDRSGGFWEGDFPAHIQSYLSSAGIDQSSFFGLSSSRLRCTETYIAVGDELYVLGFGNRSGDLVQFTKKKGFPHIISDYPEDKVVQHYLLYLILGAIGSIGLAVGAFFCITSAS